MRRMEIYQVCGGGDGFRAYSRKDLHKQYFFWLAEGALSEMLLRVSQPYTRKYLRGGGGV